MTTGSVIDSNTVRMNLLMRRICKSIVTTGEAEFSMVKPNSSELWFEGKIVLENGKLSYEKLTSNCDKHFPQQLLVDLNEWYVDLDKTIAPFKGVA